MQSRAFKTIIYIATLVFLAVGSFILAQDAVERRNYKTIIDQTVYAAENPDTRGLKNAEDEIDDLAPQIKEVKERISEAEKVIAQTEESNLELQQEYEKLAETADADYYNAIMESLREGMSLVESQINSGR